MIMEQRTRTRITSFPHWDAEPEWQPFIAYLEREHPELGPVLSWDGPDVGVVVLADDQPDAATAAETAAHVIADALRHAGLGDRFASVEDVEPADADTPVLA